MIKPNRSGHYYNSNGDPMFDAKLTQAKKFNFLPSVTTVMNVIAKPGLETWKQEQILKAALEMKQNDAESQDDYIKRIVTQSREKSSTAVDFGSAVHKAIENYILYMEYPDDKRIRGTIESVKKVILDEIDRGYTEKRLTSQKFGFAGTPDWYGELKSGRYSLIDWKTQGIKWKEFKRPTDDKYEIEKDGVYLRPVPVYYDEMIMQLWACGQMILETEGIEIENYYSVIINSDEEHSEVIYVREWDADQVNWGKDAFLATLKLWRAMKRFPYKEECDD